MTETTQKHPVELDDLFRIKAVSEAQFSPDGKWVIYGQAHIDVKQEKQLTSLWLYCMESGLRKQLTSGTANDSNAAWSPDSKHIAFLSTRNQTPQVYIIAVDGGEARKLTEMKQGIGSGPLWSPDGKTIAFTAGSSFDEPPDPKKPYRVNRTVYRFDAIGYLDDKVQDIYIIRAEGGEPKQLTDDRFSNDLKEWSPDSKGLLYLVMSDPDSSRPHPQAIRTVDMEGTIREIHRDWGIYGSACWLPNGKGILISGQENGNPIGTKNDLWVLDLERGSISCRTGKLKFGVGGGLRNDVPVAWKNEPQISKDGKKAFVNVQQGGTVQIYQVALDGEESWEPLISGDRLAALLDANTNGLLYICTDFSNPCDLFTMNINDRNEKQLTSMNEELTSAWELARVEHLLYPGVDGTQVEGWVLLPAEGKGPFPTVMYIHGGPHAAFGHAFNFDFQFLAANGYATLIINHRASTGYGDAFSTAIKGDWGNLDYQDLIFGVDYAIAKGYSNADKLGCTGISGGGNLSCWIVGNTDRFKAAMPENPVTNWLSFYGTSDIGIWFSVEELGGHPHEIPEIYRKCSPITYAHNCTTPTLLVQGEHDYRCPAEQSEQFYTVLKANGCVVEMLRFPNSSHGGAITGTLAVRRAHREALLDWMDRYVKGTTIE